MGLSRDCLFVVFTAKPLRTYRHFHQHSVVHSTHFAACVPSAFNVLFSLSHCCALKEKNLCMTPLSPWCHLSASVRPDCHLMVSRQHSAIIHSFT